MPKRLILPAFDGYEAVRLWWLMGSSGVIDFEKILKFGSIPTLASKSKRKCRKDLGK